MASEALRYNNMAIDAYNKHQYKDAEALFKKAIEADKNYAEAYANLGALYAKFKMYEKAVGLYQKSISLKPSYAGAWTNMGNALNKLKKHEEAVYFHKMAIKLDAKSANHYSNCASAYKNLGRLNLARSYYAKALQLDPLHVNAHFDLATVLLQEGLYEAGLKEYEWRFKKEEMQGHIQKYQLFFRAPRYTPDAAKGSRVLVHSEQGFGDTLMMARYLYMLKERGIDVVVHVRKELQTLFEDMECVTHVYVRGEDEQNIEFDYQIPFMSLALVLDKNLHNITQKYPYITTNETASLPNPKKYNIGIVWGASNTGESYANKVFDVRYFKPLSTWNDIQVYSLQVGKDSEDLKRYNLDAITDMSAKLNDFRATAQVLNALDLVITSDTSVAHLAGAMGKEVWIVLQKVPDWRWGIVDTASVWYPSARLFFQHSIGDFDSVFRDIYSALKKRYAMQTKGVDV